jgi:hypothetical protein
MGVTGNYLGMEYEGARFEGMSCGTAFRKLGGGFSGGMASSLLSSRL